ADDDVGGNQHHQQQAGQQACHKHFAHGNTGNQRVQDHQHAWRHQDSPTAAGIDTAQRHFLVIAPFQHGRQGNGAHGDHGGATDTAHGGEQSTDSQSTNGQAAANAAAPKEHHMIEVLGHPGSLQQHGHHDI